MIQRFKSVLLTEKLVILRLAFTPLVKIEIWRFFDENPTIQSWKCVLLIVKISSFYLW